MPNESTSKPRSAAALIVLMAAIGAGAGGVYLADQLYYKPLREQKQMVENLKAIVEKLTKEQRIAEVMVVEQTADPLTTTVRFQEVDENDNPVGAARTFKLEGSEVYIDMLVIKFADGFKPLNDEKLDEQLKQKGGGADLVGRSIILFRRIFSDKLKPESGLVLDTKGEAPVPYKTPSTKFEQDLWQDFWKLANDPDLAKSRGVEKTYGVAVYLKMERDNVYIVEKRGTGDPSIRKLPVPPVLRRN